MDLSMKRYPILAVCVAAVILGACAKESSLPKATGEAAIRALNAIPASPEMVFLIEERVIGSATTKAVTATSIYDDLTYTFNFQTLLAGDSTTTRVASQFLNVEADKDYTFVVSGALATPDITIWEADQREWTGTETAFEARMAHVAETLGSIDIYLADPVIPPTLGSQIATLAFGEIAAPVNFEAGEYVMTITPAGDDTTILFVSDPVTILAQSQYIMTVFDGDENDLAPISVRLFNISGGGSGALVDSRFPPQMRFIHGGLNFGDADIYIDDPLTVPVVTDHAFKDFTPFIDVTEGELPVTYTPPGNPGMTLIDVDQAVFAGTRTDFFVLNDADGANTWVSNLADRRSIQTRARLSFMNTAGGRSGVDVYIVPDGEELLEDTAPILPGLPLGFPPVQIPIVPDIYDVYITDIDEDILLAGPITLDLDFGDVVETIIFENVDPTVVDFEIIPAP
jgi:hypothetical protein